MQPSNAKVCKRCGKPVTVNAENYDLFEKMHWLCFHLEFEHQADPDAPCSDPSCPWWQLKIFRQHITGLGHNPDKLIEQAIRDSIKS
jgi:hypothetical protein